MKLRILHFFHKPEQLKNIRQMKRVVELTLRLNSEKKHSLPIDLIYTPVQDSSKLFPLPLWVDSIANYYEFKNNFGKRKEDLITMYQELNTGTDSSYLMFLDGDEVISRRQLENMLENILLYLQWGSHPILGLARYNYITAIGAEQCKVLEALREDGGKDCYIADNSTPQIPDSMKEASLINWKYPDIQQRIVRLDVTGIYQVTGLTHEKIFYRGRADTTILPNTITHIKTVEEQCNMDKFHRDLLSTKEDTV